ASSPNSAARGASGRGGDEHQVGEPHRDRLLTGPRLQDDAVGRRPDDDRLRAWRDLRAREQYERVVVELDLLADARHLHGTGVDPAQGRRSPDVDLVRGPGDRVAV